MVDEAYVERVLSLVESIPAGRVTTYGILAEAVGRGGPRGVGRVMALYGAPVPWWRVVRASGEVPGGLLDEALARWRTEATALVGGALAGRRVDMTRARWDGQARPVDSDEAPTGAR